MTQNKLTISQDSFFDTYPHNPLLLNQQNFIKDVFINYGLIPSQIYIAEHTHLYTIHFKIFLIHKRQYKILKPIFNFIKSIMILKYNKNIIFNIKLSPNLYSDPTQLAIWLKLSIENQPSKLRPLIKKIFNHNNLTYKKNVNKKTYQKLKKININLTRRNNTSKKFLKLNNLQNRVWNLRVRNFKNKKSKFYYSKYTFHKIC